jgi:dUTP pyrophosphatase
MTNRTLRVRRLAPAAILPSYAHPGDAGLDLFAVADAVIPPGEWRKIPTGIAIELPDGTEAQVRPRSGIAANHGVTVLNSPGTIDAGYRGEVAVLLINHGRTPFQVEPGMKVAQMVVAEVTRVAIDEATELEDSARGGGGFGSTGV